jgi:RimJ/RimL family protein N-acetyltransferase
MEEIRTERLLLRRARESDLAAIHAILTDTRAMRYWSSLPHTSLDETREWLGRMIASDLTESYDFVVDLDGVAIGKAGCYRVPEIGYVLHPDHWGKGYAREALTAVIPRIFERFDIPAIEADIDPRNAASIGLLVRLGFELSGQAQRTWLIGEEWCDSVYYRLKRP